MAEDRTQTPIQHRYAQQYADDLAANRKEQGDVTAQIAGLQERLEQLKAEESWLTRAQGSLPGAPEVQPAAVGAEAPSATTAGQADTFAPVEPAAEAPQSVPQPRQERSVKAERPERAARKTAAAKAPRKATAKKTASKKPRPEKAPVPSAASTATDAVTVVEKSGPPLWRLALAILLKTPGQPCVAREVHDQLAQDHPDRATSIQTVRNSLETLVAKSLAERSKQQGSVMYTASAKTGADAGSAAGKAGGDTKVPARV
ncbi:hypothetical protein ACFZCF_29965 [Streptomyces sp. NPDC007945]|uniref:hypothetical protein n=1 Tax=Streptomyces sp. NPDC007945 TaxID=3364797 RepID=UPI0036F06168